MGPISKHGNGSVCYLTKCEKCGDTSNFEDSFNALSLSIPDKGKLGLISESSTKVDTSEEEDNNNSEDSYDVDDEKEESDSSLVDNESLIKNCLWNNHSDSEKKNLLTKKLS